MRKLYISSDLVPRMSKDILQVNNEKNDSSKKKKTEKEFKKTFLQAILRNDQ